MKITVVGLNHKTAPVDIREKLAFNAETDHQLGFDNWSEAAVRMFWDTKEAEEAKTAFKEKRKPDFSDFR